ncbi:DinB family protein [Paenibacillus sp. MER 180]|uniref:DinB family protein n=1 Tax=Paenibacillus sp. MER 180 TaxID=2939570 RepID=UPI00203A6987|nr:DinB family protein [Paenibacillus sp. MER 180]MCM3289679.1 DinB family protein [Paenibacillus sp. MER 180]
MEKLIEEYKQDYVLLREAVEGLSEEELHFHPAPDKWSIHQVVIHVTDDEILSTHRLRKVLAEEEPLLLSFDQNAWSDNLGYELLNLEQHLLLFQTLRASMLPLLENLTPEQLERVGKYPDGVQYTFKELLKLRTQHVRDHLAQINRVKQAYFEVRM